MNFLNLEKKEELGWETPLEVYYGRKPHELVEVGRPIRKPETEFSESVINKWKKEDLLYVRGQKSLPSELMT